MLEADGGGGYAGGPKEQELLQIFGFSSGVKAASEDWKAAAGEIEAIVTSVKATQDDLSESWRGDAAEAAYAAMTELQTSLAQRAAQLTEVSAAVDAANTAATQARHAYDTQVTTAGSSIPTAQYTTLGQCRIDGTTTPGKFDAAGYDAAVRAAREDAAQTALNSLNSSMDAATARMPVDAIDRVASDARIDTGAGPRSSGSPNTVGSTSFSSGTHAIADSAWGNTGTLAQHAVSGISHAATSTYDHLTSADGTVAGVIPGADGSLPGGLIQPGEASHGSGLTGASGVGGMLAGGIGAVGMLRGGGRAAAEAAGRLPLSGFGSPVIEPEGALGGAGARGAGMVRPGALGGQSLAGEAGVSGQAGAGARGTTNVLGGQGGATGGRGGMMGGGSGASDGGGTGVRGASSAGRYGVPKLDGASGRTTSVVGQSGTSGEQGSGSGSGSGRGSGSRSGHVGASGSHERRRGDRDFLTHEDEQNWYDDAEATPAVWK